LIFPYQIFSKVLSASGKSPVTAFPDNYISHLVCMMCKQNEKG